MSTEGNDDNSGLTTLQLQTVNQAFERLYGYTWGKKFELQNNLTKDEQVLVEMLGRRSAARLLQETSKRQQTIHLASKNTVHKKPQSYKFKAKERTIVARKPTSATGVFSSTMSATKKDPRSLSAASSAAKAPPPSSSSPSSSTAKPPQPQQGVDHLLAQINGPTKITTIAKTNMDWEQFKDDSGLGETLEAAAQGNSAYLKKQDFLNRVDQRTFQLEKTERDKERAKRGK